jgi:hypothetical protein
VGKTLKATGQPKSWQVSYRWLRGGVPIAGATKSSYKLTGADAGLKISVEMSVARTGYQSAVRTSATKTVAKATPKVAIKLSKSTVKRNAESFVTITITSSGVIPTGKIVIKAGKGSGTFTLTPAHNGKLTVQLINGSKGSFKIKATYNGNTQLKKKASKTVTLKVK